jgi:hypothetical protein
MAKTKPTGCLSELDDPPDAFDLREWFLAYSHRFCHERIKEALNGAGFEVQYMEKQSVHPFWEVEMKRGTGILAASGSRSRAEMFASVPIAAF